MTDEAGPDAGLWVLVSLTGAGREAALEALGRAGAQCVDGLPAELLDPLARAAAGRTLVAAVDAREGEGVALAAVPAGAHVVFLEADDATLVRRLADSTAPHPCASAGTGRAAVAAERRLLESLRAVAEVVIDTAELDPVEIGRRVVASVRPSAEPGHLVCTVTSFGFKYGPAVEADWVADVRFLPNPFWDERLRPRTGLDPEVSRHVLDNVEAAGLLGRLTDLLAWVAACSDARGRRRLQVAVGCTGGRHRSVAVAEALGVRLAAAGWAVEVRHRDIDRPDPR